MITRRGVVKGRARVLGWMWLLALTVCTGTLVTAALPRLDGSESKTASACEDGQLNMTCEVGEVIRILRANYGRFTYSVCNKHGQTEGWNLQCMLPKAKDIISERCDGRHKCDMQVSNQVFGDPCPLTSKYAEVKYTCDFAPTDTVRFQISTSPTPPFQPLIPLNGSPRPPVIKSVDFITPRDAEVTWTQETPRNPILTTAIFIKDNVMDTEPRVVYTNSRESYILDHLKPGTSYNIFMKSFNSHGPSASSNIVNIETPSLEEGHGETTTVASTDRTTLSIHEKPAVSAPQSSSPLSKSNATKLADADTTTTPEPDLLPPIGDPSIYDYGTNDPEVTEHNVKVEEEDKEEAEEEDDEKNDDDVSRVLDKFCEEMIHRGVNWPKTRLGRILKNDCPANLKGMAMWRCVEYGWEKPGPDLAECTSLWLETADVQIAKMMRGEVQADVAAASLTESVIDREYTSGDLKKISTKLLPKLITGLQMDQSSLPWPQRVQMMRKFKKAFMNASSDLLSKRNFQSWRSLSRQDRRRAATSLILAMEDMGFQNAKMVNLGDGEVIVDENIVMEIKVLDTQQTHSDFTFPAKQDLWKTPWEKDASSDTITIRSTSLKVLGMKGALNLVFTLYRNMEDLIQPQINTMPVSVSSSTSSDKSYHAEQAKGGHPTDENLVTSPGLSVLNSRIIAASVNGTRSRRKLAEPVLFTLQHLEPSKGKPICSFWDMDTSYLSGQWSQEGCQLLQTNWTHTTCQCDHLTNFAVLMDITGVELSAENELALRVITFVGCIISVVCLLLSWVTFLVFKNLQCDRNTIHRNLVFCLLLAEILFVGGIAQTEPKIMCSVIAGILHYLFLGAFAWMCLEGVQLYTMLVEVFEQEKSRVLWYYLFGYGTPAVIVAISAGIYHEGYGTARHCWLTTENYFIWSFVGPALAVILINIGLLSFTIYTMCHHSIMSVTMRERSKATKFSAWVKGAVILVVLLGLTWLLGVMYLNEESVVMAYFFTVLNSLQGLFIFVFHCLQNEKVQKEYRKVARRTTWLPECIRVNYGGYNGVASNSQAGSSDSRNYFSKLFGRKRNNRSSSGSVSSSAKALLRKDQQRISDADNSVSKDSSNIPSSLNGYVYNPNYSANGGSGGASKAPTFSNMVGGVPVNGGQTERETGYKRVHDLALNLSECVDCSVVDSEFVSEYCQRNLLVNSEPSRYSTSSSERSYGEKTKPKQYAQAAPLDSNTSSWGSSCADKPDRSISADLDKASGASSRKEPLDLHQYVISASRKNNTQCDPSNTSEFPLSENSNSKKRRKTSNQVVPPQVSHFEAETLPYRVSVKANKHSVHVLPEAQSQLTAGPLTHDTKTLSSAVEEPLYEEVRTSTNGYAGPSTLAISRNTSGECCVDNRVGQYHVQTRL